MSRSIASRLLTSRLSRASLATAGLLLAANAAQAAFIVQVDTDGVTNNPAAGTFHPNLSFGNGGTTASFTTTSGTAAPGIQPGNTIFGGNAPNQDQYIFSYTPGTDADNFTFEEGAALGNGNTATGVTGGGSGLYNVYAAWPNTNNISDNGAVPTQYVASSDTVAATAGYNQDEDTNGDLVGGGWVYIGQVQLTAGNTYTVTQTAPNTSFVSMRASGVMWEAVVPEPTSLSLLALGVGALVRRRRPVA